MVCGAGPEGDGTIESAQGPWFPITPFRGSERTHGSMTSDKSIPKLLRQYGAGKFREGLGGRTGANSTCELVIAVILKPLGREAGISSLVLSRPRPARTG